MSDFLFQYGEIVAIIMYFLPALISLFVFWLVNKKLIWLSIPITIAADLIAFWGALTNYEFRQLALIFLVPQIIVVTIISVITVHLHRKSVSLHWEH